LTVSYLRTAEARHNWNKMTAVVFWETSKIYAKRDLVLANADFNLTFEIILADCLRATDPIALRIRPAQSKGMPRKPIFINKKNNTPP
jgi:hypothetical protein